MKLAFLSILFHPLPKGSPWFTATPDTFYLKIALWRYRYRKNPQNIYSTPKTEGTLNTWSITQTLRYKHTRTHAQKHTQRGLWEGYFTNSVGFSNYGSRKQTEGSWLWDVTNTPKVIQGLRLPKKKIKVRGTNAIVALKPLLQQWRQFGDPQICRRSEACVNGEVLLIFFCFPLDTCTAASVV